MTPADRPERDDDLRPSKDGEKRKGPALLIDTLGDPDPKVDPAEEIEEKGEPFEGNHA